MQNNERQHQPAAGSGSAEQKGQERSEQQSPTGIQQSERERIASEIGEDPGTVSSIDELGGSSGRDDSAGGSGDGMEQQSSNQPTSKF